MIEVARGQGCGIIIIDLGRDNMTKRLKSIIKGVGSVMDISPNVDYGRFVTRQSPADKMRGHWGRTGESIKRATDRFAHEQKIKK